MHGLNKKFLQAPQKFLDEYIILMPHTGKDPWGYAIENQTFDLRKDNRGIFGSKCCLLTTMKRRGKSAGIFTNHINGRWDPIKISGGFTARAVSANHNPYFIFTEQLGGCSIGILNKRSQNTMFAHEPNPGPDSPICDYELTLTKEDYDPEGNGINTSGVCWWNGYQWNIGSCVTYSTHYLTQDIGRDCYPIEFPDL